MTTTVIPQPTARQPRRKLWLVLGGAVAFILVAAIAYTMIMIRMMNAPVPTDLDLALSKPTDAGLYRAAIASRLDPITINTLHAWTIHVETPDGKPVEGAQITVDGGMPQHGHGLPTQPKVTRYLGQGDYLVEGMKFNMPGWWVLSFEVTAGGQKDKVTFNLVLK